MIADRMQVLTFAARVALGALLLVAGILKAGHAADLASALAGFRLLPASVIEPLAVALPYFEIVLGVYLLIGLFTRAVAVITSAQFVLYGAAIASAVIRHIPANCGCFGPGDTAVADWPHVAFDLALAALAAGVALLPPRLLALDRRIASKP